MKKLFGILLAAALIFQTGAVTALAGEISDEASDEVTAYAGTETHTYSLSLSYDDSYDLADLGIPDDAEYVIYKTEYGSGEGITSSQVSNGQKTEYADTDLLIQKEEGGIEVTAAAVGSGTVWLVPADQVGILDNGGSETVEIYQIKVTVTPAVLTLMFLTGQSNMEGYCDSYTGYDRGASVSCREGTVYSTYVPWSSSTAYNISGIMFGSLCTTSDYASTAGRFVAGSLSGDTNMSGDALEYSTDSLADGHLGKTGPDSALGWEWNALTGDKVWVVNAAYGATNISEWVPGGSCYQRSNAVWQEVLKTYNAEISAGHYTAGSRLVFWQQGETEDATYLSAEDYEAAFYDMYSAMKQDIGMDALGIIMVRAGYAVKTSDYRTEKDLKMTGPRIAQYWLGTGDSSCPDAYVVSNANEQWVNNNSVSSYFKNRYGSYLSYPTQDGSNTVPATVNAVHYNIHYSQTGHNENGITAAEGMFNALNGAAVESVSWHDADGQEITPPLTLTYSNDTAIAVAVAEPVYAAKQLFVASGQGNVISYDAASGVVSGADAAAAGTGDIVALAGLRRMALSVSVTVPTDLSGEAGADYTGLFKYNGSWWYLENGMVQPDYEGVVKNSEGWWYVNNGQVDFDYTGFAENSNGWWYIEDGKVTFDKNSVIKDTNKKIDGESSWWYVVGSKVQTNYTGVANYKNSSGWWYVENGKVDFTANTVAKNKNGWWYVKDGKVIFSYSGFGENSNGKWYVEDGKVKFDKNSVIKDAAGAVGEAGSWYYVTGSKVQTDYTGVADYKNANGWWYIKNGKVDFTANTVAKNKNGWWYVTDGKVQFGFTGLADYKNANGWWYILNGKVDFSHTGVDKNKNGWWYVDGGKVIFTFNGIANNENGWWYILNGRVDFSYNGNVTYAGRTYAVTNGRVAR